MELPGGVLIRVFLRYDPEPELGMQEFVAYIDESGVRSLSPASSHHFIMGAVFFRKPDAPLAKALLANLRARTGRHPGHALSWKNISGHPQRLFIAQELGRASFIQVSTVVVCKRLLKRTSPMHDDDAYLLTLRFLLERLTWLARDRGGKVACTVAHIIRFPAWKLRKCLTDLFADPNCQIEWSALDGPPVIEVPARVEELQLADLASSATGAAFNVDQFGNPEPRYLREMLPVFYRRGDGPRALISYGLKLHPKEAATHQDYQWTAAL